MTNVAGQTRPTTPLTAPAPIMEAARATCAARLRARDSEAEAQAFERGERDDAWAMRHQVAKVLADNEFPATGEEGAAVDEQRGSGQLRGDS